MSISTIITQLETVASLDGKVVYGTPAKLANVSDPPYCWITGVSETAGPSPSIGTVRQRIETRFDITLGVLDAADLDTLREEIFTALMNFSVGVETVPVTFVAGGMEFGDEGWWYWRDTFTFSYWRDAC